MTKKYKKTKACSLPKAKPNRSIVAGAKGKAQAKDVINIEDINYKKSKECEGRKGECVAMSERRVDNLSDNLSPLTQRYYTAKSEGLLAKLCSYVMLWAN